MVCFRYVIVNTVSTGGGGSCGDDKARGMAQAVFRQSLNKKARFVPQSVHNTGGAQSGTAICVVLLPVLRFPAVICILSAITNDIKLTN
jgi:hypothetical protein